MELVIVNGVTAMDSRDIAKLTKKNHADVCRDVRAAKTCKQYADAAGAEFYCIDRAHSKYKYVPGFKIAWVLTGRE